MRPRSQGFPDNIASRFERRGVAHPGDRYSWTLFNPVRSTVGGPPFPGSVGDIFWGEIKRLMP